MNENIKNMKFNIVAIIAIIIFCFAISPVTLQNDTFYTIAIGEHVLQNGIDMKDPFSWHDNLDYTYPHWAYDVMIYLIYSVGGQLGIYISTIVFASILGISLYLTNVRINKNRITSFILTLGVMYLLADYVAARAQLVTFICFVFEIYFIEMFLKTGYKRYPIGLVIISILIANLHVAVWPFYFILFLPYIAEYIVYSILDLDITFSKLRINFINKKIKKAKTVEQQEKRQAKINELEDYIKRSANKKQKVRENPYKLIMEKNKNAKYLIIVMIICAFSGLLTPLGETPYTYLYNTMQGNTTQSISEHLPLTLINNKYFMCVLIMFFTILIFTDTKIKLRDLFMLGGLLFLSFMTRRQISMFILICVYILNRFICYIFDKYDPKGCEKIQELSTTFLGKTFIIALVALIAIVIFRPKIDNKFIDEASYPVAASDYILNNLNLEEIKLYNEYNYGSYLLFREIPVFIDSRADLYSPEFNPGKDVFTDFLNISSVNLNYDEKFDEYGITHIITYKNSKLKLCIDMQSNYNKLYEDDYFIIYER